jgi:hypothetical protein
MFPEQGVEPPDSTTARFDLTIRGRQKRIFGGTIVVLGGLGALSLIGTVLGGRTFGWAIFGGVLILAAVLLGSTWKRVCATRTLEVNRRGIRHVVDDPRTFEVTWGELAELRLSYARKPGNPRTATKAQRTFAEDAPAGGDPANPAGVRTYVRLDLVPADQTFLQRHPNMVALRRSTLRPADSSAVAPWSDDVLDRQAIIRLSFGERPDLYSHVDAALRRFAGERYHVPVNEGLASGTTYS